MTEDLVGAATPAPRAHRLVPGDERAAAQILAECAARKTPAAGAGLLASLKSDPTVAIYAMKDEGEVVALFALRRGKLAVELALLIVAPSYRNQGYGRACVAEARRRVGRWPLVVETTEAAVRFYERVEFKLVSRHRSDGEHFAYRLAWHPPRPATEGTYAPTTGRIRGTRPARASGQFRRSKPEPKT